jgi:hypothetical protein
MSIQLEGNFLGSIKAIDHVVVDKIGMYAYPLRSSSDRRSSVAANPGGFQNTVIVSIQARRRTKTITVHTPYSLENRSSYPLQFKV